jgi:hypothetical protein
MEVGVDESRMAKPSTGIDHRCSPPAWQEVGLGTDGGYGVAAHGDGTSGDDGALGVQREQARIADDDVAGRWPG